MHGRLVIPTSDSSQRVKPCLDAFQKLLQEANADVVQRYENSVEAYFELLALRPNHDPYAALSSLKLSVSAEPHALVVTYALGFNRLFLFCAAASVAAIPIGVVTHSAIIAVVWVAGVWLWACGGNMIGATIRQRRLLRRTVRHAIETEEASS